MKLKIHGDAQQWGKLEMHVMSQKEKEKISVYQNKMAKS